jgi:hypothetical protein
MDIPINPSNAQDIDQPLNTDPMYSATHIFSTADVTATFDGQTQGDVGASFIDFSGANGTMVTKEGVTLYPIDSEFGYNVTDFVGAEEKTIDGLYTEGWAGDLMIEGQQAGLVISDAPTDTFKTPAVLGTWLAGLGGNNIKASTEHYTVMQQVLSDQQFPDDPGALYPLDNDLILLSQNAAYNGQHVTELLAGTALYEGAAVTVADVNQDGVVDLKDLLNPNESTISYDIAYSTDYSVTMKDDGKLLYRWGNNIKKPNDVRIEAELPLPDEWAAQDDGTAVQALYRVTAAELLVHHTITNNPNDQIRPEDFENESAIGTLPTYEVIENYNGEAGRTVWASTDDYYAGDGTLYPAGTILRDSMLADAAAGSVLDQIGAMSSDLEQGFTNAWYTTMDREPFEPVLNDDGTEYITGPRWRLQPDKYGQDLPSVVIPIDPSAPLPTTSEFVKYDVGAETQTVINMLDWASPISPLELSTGWQNNAGTVSGNGLNMTQNLDVAFYIKGDIKPATIYSTTVVMDYEAVDVHLAGTDIIGTAGSDFLVGIGHNSFTGGAGEDLFVLSYGTSVTDVTTANVVTDFEVGVDKLGLIGFDALAGFNFDSLASTSLITQGVSGNDLTISVVGEHVATLTGVALELGIGAAVDPGEGLDLLDSFLISNPHWGGATPDSNVIVGTDASEVLTGTVGDDIIYGLAGDDLLQGSDGDDLLLGQDGNDTVLGQDGDDMLGGGNGDDLVGGGSGDDELYGAAGEDSLFGGIDGNDMLTGGAGADQLTGGTEDDVFVFRAVSESFVGTRDTITDFEAGDLINLAQIDANTLVAGDQAFDFIGTSAFSSTAGELRFVTDGTDGYVVGDVDGDAATDFVVQLMSVTSMDAGDFLL